MTREKPYHHGDLRQAMLAAAEHILETEGIGALSLRSAARSVGVSHTAPRNHFGDMTGLLSDLAAEGYRRFAASLSEVAEEAGADPQARLRAMGRAYIRFAADHPGLFTLMFRSEQLDRARPTLREAIAASGAVLRDTLAARTLPGRAVPPLVQAGRAAAVRSLVHGFAVLMLENRLNDLLASVPGLDVYALFEMVLNSVSLTGAEEQT